jgi:hypothetical protein
MVTIDSPNPLNGLEFCPRCSSGPRQKTDTVECPDCGYHWSWAAIARHIGTQGAEGMTPQPALITAHVCGGKQARICPVTKQPHDMSAIVRFKDGGSVACKDCGVTAMQIDLIELP